MLRNHVHYSPLALLVIVTVSMFTFFPNTSLAESNNLEDTISVGHRPTEVAVNPSTNRIYVTNYESSSVSVIDGSTHRIVENVTVGVFPSNIAVNPNTNMIYVAHRGPEGSLVSVIDGGTNRVQNSVIIGSNAIGLAVNPDTNMIYVGQSKYPSGSVFVIDGSLDKIIHTISTPNSTGILAVNPHTARLYMASGQDGSIIVIDTGTNTIIDTIKIGTYSPIELVVNPNTNKIYILNLFPSPSDTVGVARSWGYVLVIDGSTNRILTNTTLGFDAWGIAVDSNTDNVYVSYEDTQSRDRVISVIDGSTDMIINNIKISKIPDGIAFNSNTDELYAVHPYDDTLSVIHDPEFTKTQSFAVSSTLDGNNYAITGKSENVKVKSFTIYPKWGIEIKLNSTQGGKLELTLSKNMIEGIQTVDATVEDMTSSIIFQEISSDPSTTTIRFTVPDNADDVEIKGTTVVPEFPVSIMIATVAIGLVLGIMRLGNVRRSLH